VRIEGGSLGLQIGGTSTDADDNKTIYEKEVTPQQIISGAAPAPASVKMLIDTLNKYSPVKEK
jgi:lipid-binding SYLF domain-containing protein